MFLGLYLDSLILLVLIACGPNELAEPVNFLVSVKVVSTCVVRNALNKEGKKPETKASKIQHLVSPRVLQHTRQHIALQRQHTKKSKEEAAEYAKVFAKRMKEAKENTRTRLPRGRGCPLRASTSESSEKSLSESNK